MNELLDSIKDLQNFALTENGGLTHVTTKSKVYDLFSLGGAMRFREPDDCRDLFWDAFYEDPILATRCLFYLRDIRGGQGERRFFRTCLHDFACQAPDKVRQIIKFIPEYGRYDDLYTLVDTPLETEMFELIKDQLLLDIKCQTPSLLAKWLKSENASSSDTKQLANLTRQALGFTHKEYRKMLSLLRSRINIVETLMSQNRWEEIEFDKIPSKAGLQYRNAFARRDIIKEKYQKFMESEDTTVNAGTLYPYDVINKVRHLKDERDTVSRATFDKYWDNLTDYFNNATFNGLAVVDTSGSMFWSDSACGGSRSILPIDVAISLGLYCADKAKGPFANHFMTFSTCPKLVEITGKDLYDKVDRMSDASWGGTTNIAATFDLILNAAIREHLPQESLPQNIIIISDMEFDYINLMNRESYDTVMETCQKRWESYGYKLPHLIFWNVDARQKNIPMKDEEGITFVSGCSPVIFDMIMSGKTGYDLMLDKLNGKRYSQITFSQEG